MNTEIDGLLIGRARSVRGNFFAANPLRRLD
jgi:hypothetical protein